MRRWYKECQLSSSSIQICIRHTKMITLWNSFLVNKSENIRFPYQVTANTIHWSSCSFLVGVIWKFQRAGCFCSLLCNNLRKSLWIIRERSWVDLTLLTRNGLGVRGAGDIQSITRGPLRNLFPWTHEWSQNVIPQPSAPRTSPLLHAMSNSVQMTSKLLNSLTFGDLSCINVRVIKMCKCVNNFCIVMMACRPEQCMHGLFFVAE